MLVLMLAAAIPCADRAACPTRAEVERALAEQEYEYISQRNEAANAPGSDRITLIPLQRIRIAGIRCDAPAGTPLGVTCHATIYRHQTRASAVTVRLVRRHRHWAWETPNGIYMPSLIDRT
jgi:hypothetical protein